MHLTARRIFKRSYSVFKVRGQRYPFHSLTALKNKNCSFFTKEVRKLQKVTGCDKVRRLIPLISITTQIGQDRDIRQKTSKATIELFRCFTGITPREGKSEENRKKKSKYSIRQQKATKKASHRETHFLEILFFLCTNHQSILTSVNF